MVRELVCVRRMCAYRTRVLICENFPRKRQVPRALPAAGFKPVLRFFDLIWQYDGRVEGQKGAVGSIRRYLFRKYCMKVRYFAISWSFVLEIDHYFGRSLLGFEIWHLFESSNAMRIQMSCIEVVLH